VKKLFYVAAILYLFTFVCHFIISFVRAWGSAHGGVPSWAVDQSIAVQTLDVLGLICMLATWIGGIYYWSNVKKAGLTHGVALVFLVVLGIFVAPFYILLSSRSLQVWDGSNSDPTVRAASGSEV
jgi:small-conductance mechanosensitive channel